MKCRRQAVSGYPIHKTVLSLILGAALFFLLYDAHAASSGRVTYNGKTYPGVSAACSALLADLSPPQTLKQADPPDEYGNVHCVGKTSDGEDGFDMYQNGVRFEPSPANEEANSKADSTERQQGAEPSTQTTTRPDEKQDCVDDARVPRMFTATRAREIYDEIFNHVKTSGWTEYELTAFKKEGNVGVARVCLDKDFRVYVGIKVPKGSLGAVDPKTGKSSTFYDPNAVGDWASKNLLKSGEVLAGVVVNPAHAEDAVKDTILKKAKNHKTVKRLSKGVLAQQLLYAGNSVSRGEKQIYQESPL